MSNKNNAIAIVFDDLTEFFVMREAIDELTKLRIPTDIIVPHDSGYNGLAEHTFNSIKELGYHPLEDAPKDKVYKILLTPYPELKIIKRLKFIYHLRYPYSAISAKPNPTYLPEWKVPYDGVFYFNTYEPSFLQAYGSKCHVVPYWKFHNFKHQATKSSKPILLILPTFGSDVSCVKLFNQTSIKELKEHYHIISKAHHATHFNTDEAESLKLLESLSDEFYDSNTSILELLKKADLVLSDNSGAIFEAICANVPVALFAKDLNKRHLDKIDTLQYQLARQTILPYTDKPNELLSTLQSIKNYTKKQTALRDQLFLKLNNNPVSAFIDTLKGYLLADPSKDYYKTTHDLLVNKLDSFQSTIDNKDRVINELNKRIEEQNNYINDIHNSTSWKITKPLRDIKQFYEKKRSKND